MPTAGGLISYVVVIYIEKVTLNLTINYSQLP